MRADGSELLEAQADTTPDRRDAWWILDIGLGVGASRIDTALFEMVAPAIQQVEAQWTIIRNEIDITVVFDLPANVIIGDRGDAAIIDGDLEP